MFTDSLAEVPVHTLGPGLECLSCFPEKANIEFAQVSASHSHYSVLLLRFVNIMQMNDSYRL